MIPDAQSKTLDNEALFRSVITDLYEAVLFSNRQDQSTKQIDELNSRRTEKLADVDELQKDITHPLKKYFEENPSESFKQASESISKFVRKALDQYKDRLSAEFLAREGEIESTNLSYVTKAQKGIESFLFSQPIPIDESATYVKYVSGGYQAVRKVQCQGDIEYDIILNTAKTDLLEDPLYFSGLYKGLRIPIRQSTSWITKETVVDREKVDSYLLVSAEFAHGTTIAVFRDDENRSEFRFVLSGAGDQAVFAIEYKDEQENVDINSHPALQNYVDSSAVREALTKLAASIKLLRANPVKISSLLLDGEDILTAQNFRKLSDRVFSILGDRIREGIEPFMHKKHVLEDLELDGQKVSDRLKFLGFYDSEVQKAMTSAL